MLKQRSRPLKKALTHMNSTPPRCRLKSLVITIVFTGFISNISLSQNSSSLDQRIVLNLSNHRTEAATKFMQYISNSTSYVSLGIPSGILLKGIILNSKTERQKGWYILKTFAINSVETYLLKYTIDRKRPYDVNSKIIKASSGGSPSFPSGHCSEAFATAASLSLVYPKWYVIAPVFAWAGMVGFSRMYLGVHYPSDVLAGALLGCGSAWVMYKLNKCLQKERKNKSNKNAFQLISE